MKKSCSAVAASTSEPCKRRTLPGSRYCYFHIERVPLLLGGLVGAILSVLAAEVYRSIVPSEESRRLAVLEAKLEPFVELAKEKFPNLEIGAALDRLRKEINEVRQLAEPPQMLFASYQAQRVDNGYFVLLQFGRSKEMPLGTVRFTASIPRESPARILQLEPAAPLTTMSVRARISDDGKVANLEFAFPGSEDPALKLHLSSATLLKVEGNHSLRPLVIAVQ